MGLKTSKLEVAAVDSEEGVANRSRVGRPGIVGLWWSRQGLHLNRLKGVAYQAQLVRLVTHQEA